MASQARLSSLGVLLALGAGWLPSTPLSAAQLTTTAVSFASGASVTDVETGTATTESNVDLGTKALDPFDPASGVLTGVTLNLVSARTPTVTVSSTAGGGNGTNKDVTSTGVGSSTAAISAPGASEVFGAIEHNGSCTGPRLGACEETRTGDPVTTNRSVPVMSVELDGYVGPAVVDVAFTAPLLEARQGPPSFTGEESTAYSIAWVGAISATYEYLLHAAPSFDDQTQLLTLDLDFGSVLLGSSASLPFDIFNLAAVDRAGLDFDGLTGSGDVMRLLTNLSPFTGLGSGDGRGFTAWVDTSSTGAFAASYFLSFSDADVGAASSRLGGVGLTLNLRGEVFDSNERALGRSVPEPATFALFSLGVAGLPFVRRRKTPA